MALSNLFRRLMTRPLFSQKLVRVRKPAKSVGGPIEELETRATPALLNYYPADGNADDVQSGNNGVIQGSVTYVPGLFGEAFNFNGSSSVDIARQVSTDFTISAWVKTTVAGSGTTFFQGDPIVGGDYPGVANDFGLTINAGGKAGFGVGGGGGGNPDETIQSTTSVNDGNWHLVTAVRSTATNTISLYVDGVFQTSLVNDNNNPLTSQSTLAIGADLVNSIYFTGEIDDVRIYDSALTSTQVMALYQLPTLSASFDGSGNLVVTDTEGDNNNLTAVVSGANLVVTDTLQTFGTIPAGGILSNNNQTLTIPFSDITGSQVVFNTGAGDDTLTVDYSGGNFPKSISYNPAGTGTLDGLVVKGSGTQSAVYTPSGTTDGSGTITSAAGNITFSNLTPVDMFGLTAATVAFPNANNVVSVANGFDYLEGGTNPALNVTGTSGGVGFEQVALWDDTNVTIDTTAVAGTDAVTINSANNANNITNFTVTEPASQSGTIAVDGAITFPGTVSLTAGLSITVAGDITAGTGGSGDVNLTSSGTIGETSPAIISTTGTLTTSSGTGTTLSDSNTVSGFNATNSTSGNISLTNTAAPLTISGISETGGGITVTNTGSLATTGAIVDNTAGNANSLTATNGSLTIGAAITGTTTDSISLTSTGSGNTIGVNGAAATGSGNISAASAGSITESGGNFGTTGLLTTNSVTGTTLGGANAVGSFNATNTTSGDVSLNNAASPLTITGISESGGAVSVTNSGSIVVTGNVIDATGGNVNLTTNTNLAVTLVRSNLGSITSVPQAEEVLTNPSEQIATYTATPAVINYAGGTVGNSFPSSSQNSPNPQPFPGTSSTSDEVNNFVVSATASVFIPTAGNWTFGTSSDDGSLLTVGPLTVDNDGTHGAVNQVAAYDFPSAGSYPLNLIYFNDGGPGEVQVFAAHGNFNSFNGNFELVGDTTNGGLALNTGSSASSISESGTAIVSTTGTLTTISSGGTTLNNANAVGTFNANNTTSGNISLVNTAAPLTISGISETGGTVNVSNTGSIALSGNVTDTTGGNVGLTSTGAIGETATAIVNTTGILTTSSATGTTLNDANTIGTFNATNSTSGNVSLVNTAAAFVISGISESGGTTTVSNAGSSTINGTGISSTGDISVSTTSNLTVSSPVTSSGGTTSLSFGSNGSGDTANINAPVTGTSATLTGGSGNDAINVTQMGATNLTVNGGGGLDQVNITTNTEASSGFPGSMGSGEVVLAGSSTYTATITSSLGNDIIDVNDQNQGATSPPPAPNGAPITGVPAITTGSGVAEVATNGIDVLNYGSTNLTTLNLVETTGTNTYNIQYPNSQVSGSKLPPTTNIQTSTTTDTANLYGTAAGGSTFDVGFTTAGTTTASLGNDAVTYPQLAGAYLATLNVWGRDKTAGDTFDVYPDAHTVVNINAGLPANGTGDTLILNAFGLTNPAIVPLFGNTALPNGEITSSNLATLTWNSIETFPVPLGLGGTFDFQPAGSVTQPGYLPVIPTDTPTSGPYAVAEDGWLDAGAGAFDRTAPLKQPANSPGLSSLLTTGEWGYSGAVGSVNNGKFQVSVAPNQDVQVTTYIGDYLVRRDINVYVGTPSNPYETLLNPSLSTFTTSGQTYQFVSYSGVFNPGSSKLMVITYNTPDNGQYWTVEGLDVRPLGLIAPLTIARVDAAPPTQPQVADGLTIDQYTGKGAAPFAELTICPTYGTPLNGSGLATDYDPAVKGFQVEADANGNFTFDILRPTGNGPSTITVTAVTGASGTGQLGKTGTGGLSVSPNPWILPSPFIQQYTLPTVRRLDFGPLGTPGASDSDPNNPNYLVFANAAYTSTAANALGWIGTAPTPYDRGSSYPIASPNNLQRDGVFGSYVPSDFEMDMPAANTMYSVTVLLGDGKNAEAGMSLKVINPTTLAVETIVASGVNTPAGQSCSITFSVESDSMGRIRLRFSTSSSTSFWTLQDIEARPAVNSTEEPPTGTQNALILTANSSSTIYGGKSTGTGQPFSATTLNDGTINADGSTVTTYTISGAVPNSLLTVKTTLGTLNATDVGPTYTGIQVQANGSGVATFSITSPSNQNNTSGTITVYAVTGAAIGVFTQNYTGAPPASEGRFDFTYNGSPVQAGYTSVPNTTVYSSTLGYGWSKAVTGYDRGAASTTGSAANLFRAGAWGQGSATFEMSVPENIPEDVRVYVGDPFAAWSGITVSVDGGTPVSVDATIDRFGFVTLYNNVSPSGILDVTIKGGTWVAAGLDVAPAGELPTPATGIANSNGLGTGSHESLEFVSPPVAPVDGYTGVTSTTTYTSTAGYGWEKAVSSFSRPASEFPASPPLSATQKVFYGNGDWGQGSATFEVAVPLNSPTATYSVRIYISDPYTTWQNIKVTGEGGVTQTVSSSVGGYVTLNGLQDINGDGILTITVSSNNVWVMNGFDIVQNPTALPPLPG